MSLNNCIANYLKSIGDDFDNFLKNKNEKEEDIYINAKLLAGNGSRKIIFTLFVDRIGNCIKKDFVKNLTEFEQNKERYFEELYKYVYEHSLIYLTEYVEKDSLYDIMTFAEASEKWGLGESTLRNAIYSARLQEEVDYRKSGKVWLITKEAMERVYGKLKNK